MNIVKKVKDAVENAREGAKEAMHLSTADAEHARRESGFNSMTTGEQIRSVANEAKNRMAASVVKVRREVRKHT